MSPEGTIKSMAEPVEGALRLDIARGLVSSFFVLCTARFCFLGISRSQTGVMLVPQQNERYEYL